MKVSLRATVHRTRAPSAVRFVASFAPLAGAIALERMLHVRWIGWLAVLAGAIPLAWRDRARERSVVASRAGLQLDDETLPRASLANAMAHTENEKTWVRVELRDESAVEIALPSAKRAEKLVKALELDDAKTALEVRLFDVAVAGRAPSVVLVLVLVVGLYVGGVYLRGHLMEFLMAFVALAIGMAFLQTHLRKVTLVAGIDGMSVTDRRGRARSVAFADIESVHSERSNVVIWPRSGEALRLAATTGRKQPSAAARAQNIVERIERLRRAWAETPEPPKVQETLGHGAFRQAHVPREVLWDALRNARTRVSDRVAAAAALRQNGTEEDIERLRVEVDRFTPAARARIRAVLDAEDETLDDVVDESARADRL